VLIVEIKHRQVPKMLKDLNVAENKCRNRNPWTFACLLVGRDLQDSMTWVNPAMTAEPAVSRYRLNKVIEPNFYDLIAHLTIHTRGFLNGPSFEPFPYPY
jgi:hypothetical protein